jgi:hypothetical protein
MRQDGERRWRLALCALMLGSGCNTKLASARDPKCSATILCGSGSYQLCASPDGTHCQYSFVDGTNFVCASCSDCQAAFVHVAAKCNAGMAPSPGVDGGAKPPGGGGDGGADGGTGGNGTSCPTNALCQYDSNCPMGQRCNTALQPSNCQSLNCGAVGTACDRTELCQSGLICGAGTCQTPPWSCTRDSDCTPGQLCDRDAQGHRNCGPGPSANYGCNSAALCLPRCGGVQTQLCLDTCTSMATANGVTVLGQAVSCVWNAPPPSGYCAPRCLVAGTDCAACLNNALAPLYGRPCLDPSDPACAGGPAACQDKFTACYAVQP